MFSNFRLQNTRRNLDRRALQDWRTRLGTRIYAGVIRSKREISSGLWSTKSAPSMKIEG